MPIYQIWIQEIAVGSIPTGYIFQRKIDEIVKDLPNVFGIVDDILVVGFDSDGKDHNDTAKRTTHMQKGKHKIKQR